jgi:hypothetical protein
MDEIQGLVFSKRPRLKELYEKEGGMKALEYLRRVHDGSILNSKVIEILKDEVKKVFADESLSGKIEDYFSKTNYVSTVDHHGLLSHASFMQAHLLQSIVNKEKNLPLVLVFSSGTVSLDNHTFPRGLTFHAKDMEKRIPIVGARHRNECVLGVKMSDEAYIKKTLLRVKREIPLSIFNILERVLLQNISASDFSTYASLTNRALFSNLPFFSGVDFIMIPHEKISARMILEMVEMQEKIFANDFISKYDLEYKNIVGAHSDDLVHGTFLFWRISGGVRQKLRLKGDVLETEDGSFGVEYKKETIFPLLQNGELLPAMALSYTILGSMGLTLGGGFNQVDYLEKIYTAGKKVFPNVSFGKSDVMGGDFVYAGVKSGEKVFNATYGDILKYLALGNKEGFIEALQNVTLGQAISGVLPDAYFTDTKKMPEKTYEKSIIF